MSLSLIFFYIVLISQICFISIYLPRLYSHRLTYVQSHFPPDEYPKLYPGNFRKLTGENGKTAIRRFNRLNLAIALLGFGIVSFMWAKGYRLDRNGGDELFVIMYFLLQLVPFFMAELSELRLYRLMREDHSSLHRSASLSPRSWTDFASPLLYLFPAVSYVCWLAIYLYVKLKTDVISGDSDWRLWLTVFAVTGFNFAFAYRIYRYISGRKHDPHQAYTDQLSQISVVVKTSLLALISLHLFLISNLVIQAQELEFFDPIATSIYCQIIAFLAMGFLFKARPIETINFDVYKKNPT